MPETTETAFNGCYRKCRIEQRHTMEYGGCEHAAKPEPTVSMSKIYTDTDGYPTIGYDQYTVPQLARLIEGAVGDPLRAAAAARVIVHRNDAPAAPAVSLPPATDQTDDTDLTEADVDQMMAAGVPVQIVTSPPATFAADQTEPVVTVHAAPHLSPEATEALGALVDVAKKQAADQTARRDRYDAAIREADGWVLDDGQHMLDAVIAVADAEQAELGEQLDEAGATIAAQTAEIKRLHARVAELEQAAASAVGRPDLRDLIAETLWTAAEHNITAEWICCEPIDPTHALCVQAGAALRMIESIIVDDPDAWKPAPLPAAVVAVLPADQRAATLREGADHLDSLPLSGAEAGVRNALTAELRRVAAEAAVTPPPALTEEGRLRAQVEVLQQDAERDQGLAKVGARCMRVGHQGLIEQGRVVLEGWRFALSTALDLGTGAPWEAIHERAQELRRVAGEEPHTTETHVVAPLRAELKPWQLLADAPAGPLPQTERLVGGRRLPRDTTETPKCGCSHAADEHSVYGCVDGCGCDRMFKRPPMDPVHILGIGADAEPPAASAVPAAPDTDVDRLQVWPLQRVLTEVRCGSQDWTWDEEWADLDRRHAETGYLDTLEQQIRERGITMPVLIGSDGRLWDGHHRLRLAVRLGIDYVPVEITPAAPDTEA